MHADLLKVIDELTAGTLLEPPGSALAPEAAAASWAAGATSAAKETRSFRRKSAEVTLPWKRYPFQLHVVYPSLLLVPPWDGLA